MWIIPSCTHSMQQTPTKNGGKLINAEPLISKKKEKTPTTTTTSTSYAKEDKVHINIANIEHIAGDSQQEKRRDQKWELYHCAICTPLTRLTCF